MKTLEDVLEEITPQPDPDFVADMEWRMQHAFPRPERKTRGIGSSLPRVALPTLRPRALAGVAASAMLALLVTVSVVGGGSDDRPPAQPAFEAFSEDASGGAAAVAEPVPVQRQGHELPPQTSDTATSTALPPVPPPGQEDVAPRAPERRVEQTAQMTLAADTDDFDGLADSIFRIADRRRGFVLRSSFTQGEEAASSGFFELRVPAAELQQTLNELSRIATVRSRGESATDVTAPFLSLRDRLRTAQAERKSLLRRLEVAPTETAAAAIRRRLAIVGRRITSLGAQLRAARERTAFATVVVELVDRDNGAAAGETDEAFDDAVGSLEDILNFIIRALGILIPVAVTALVVWLGAAYARRRARERSLA
jgi:hypothetical protein